MGTWGAGNFENDGALDYLDDLIEELASRIDTLLEEDGAADLDEAGEAELMPNVELIALLCEDLGGTPPERERVLEWKEAYISLFQDQIDDLDPAADFKEERIAVIEETFDRLLAISGEDDEEEDDDDLYAEDGEEYIDDEEEDEDGDRPF